MQYKPTRQSTRLEKLDDKQVVRIVASNTPTHISCSATRIANRKNLGALPLRSSPGDRAD